MAVTIRDIARECGVSTYTVSCTINNTGRVSEATREKIRQTIREMGYTPVQRKYRQTGSPANTIGLMVTGDLQAIHPSNYRAVMAAKAGAGKHGWDLTLYTEQDIIEKAVTRFHEGPGQFSCRGLIIYTPMHEYAEYIRSLSVWKIPVVLVRRDIPQQDVMLVRDSDRRAVTLVMDHLYGLGHRDIIFYGYEGQSLTCPDRSGTWRDYAEKNGGNTDPRLEITRRDLQHASEAEHIPANWEGISLEGHSGLQAQIEKLMAADRPPTAALCFSDQLAVEMIRTLRNMGLSVPDDFSVAGMNNDTTAVMYDPTITSVNLPAEEMVGAACDLLIEPPAGSGSARTILEFENRLIVRQSTGPVKP